jgi:superfamily II DNA/RNA helicase
MMCIGGIPFEDDRRNYANNGGTVLIGTVGRIL